MKIDFEKAFKILTGNPSLSWQRRMYRDYFALGKLPTVCDLPTGLGKTMVMAIWLIARSNGCHVPTRLIYVVDRRTVVDQATDVAAEFAYLLAPHNSEDDDRIARHNQKLVERKQQYSKQLTELCQNIGLRDGELFISTLRGQLADNRKWSTDPSRPAIIIGTVDLIGSGLLFSGYRSGFKRRPLEAGLLGQDSLLLLDEAHLSKPFQKLVGSITDFQSSHGKPMHVISMSATSGEPVDSTPFTLEFDADGKLSGADAKDQVIDERFHAKKRLTISTGVDPKKLNQALADSAIELARNDELKGKRIVVFTRRPDDAQKIAQEIRDRDKPGKSKANPEPQGPYANSVEVLTGTMRGLERDKLVETSILKRFLDGNENPDLDENNRPVFLVSTSAGEVGFDLNADHLVGDEAPLDSWIQRLGRVNRRGKGTAIVQVFAKPPADKNKGGEAGKHSIDSASANAIDMLRQLPKVEPIDTDSRPGPIFDASPCALSNLAKPDNSLSPKPTTVELTDILLDAWSMTSIRQSMPGRPAVGPWLRGIDDEQAQTTIAWRAELELFDKESTPETALQTIFSKHAIRPHETLTVNTGHLVEFLKKIPKLKERPENLLATRTAVCLSRGEIVCRTIEQLIEDPGILYADATLILPATFGGLSSDRMLDVESIPRKRKEGDAATQSLDVADHEGYEQTDAARSRLRLVIKRSDDGSWTPRPLPGLLVPGDIQLKSSYGKRKELFDDLKVAGLRVRVDLPIKYDDEDEPIESLVMLAAAPKGRRNEDQPLTEHVEAVEFQARAIADQLHLAKDDPICVALLFAAKWHDEGKKARVWQVFANNPDPDGDQPLGKMAQSRDPKSLRGYRHEFGSLLRIRHPDRCGTPGCHLPDDNPDIRELALHLIATHHGGARPHFGPAVYDSFTDTERDDLHVEIIRRFAQLQRKYDWWHLAWLENLLRCADALASADQDAEDDPADLEEDAT